MLRWEDWARVCYTTRCNAGSKGKTSLHSMHIQVGVAYVRCRLIVAYFLS